MHDLRQESDTNYTTSTRPECSETPLEAIYRTLSQELWALFYTHCFDRERATDALQESFLRLQQQDLREIRNPRSWLLHVGRNWLRDCARRRASKELTQGQLWDVSEAADSPADAMARTETKQLVRQALSRLREQDRLVLVLRYGMQWPVVRIAEMVDSTPAAIDMRLSRARRQLSKILVEDPKFDVCSTMTRRQE